MLAEAFSEVYFYFFTQPVTELEAKDVAHYHGHGEIPERVIAALSIIMAAADSIMCTLSGSDVREMPGEFKEFWDGLKKAMSAAVCSGSPVAILKLFSLMMFEFAAVIGSSSMILGAEPETPEKWALTGFLIGIQMILYQTAGIHNINTLFELTGDLYQHARPGVGEGAALRPDNNPFGELFGPGELNAINIGKFKASSLWSIYAICEGIKFITGLVCKSAAFAYLLDESTAFALKTKIHNPTALFWGAVSGGFMQLLSATSKSVQAALRKGRLAEKDIEFLDRIIAAGTFLEPSNKKEKEWNAIHALASQIKRDKEEGRFKTVIRNLLPVYDFDAKYSRALQWSIVLVGAAQFGNRTLDNSRFVEDILGEGIGQMIFSLFFAMLASSQYFTTLTNISVSAASTLLKDANRYVVAPVKDILCCAFRNADYQALPGGDVAIELRPQPAAL